MGKKFTKVKAHTRRTKMERKGDKIHLDLEKEEELDFYVWGDIRVDF